MPTALLEDRSPRARSGTHLRRIIPTRRLAPVCRDAPDRGVARAERQRILQELHNGVGAHLVGLLALLQNGTIDRVAALDAAAQALEELRLAANSMESDLDGLWQRMEVSGPTQPPSAPIVGVIADALSPREHEVLSLVARGFTYGETALRLGVSTSTVRTHARSIYSKLDVHNKTEAVFEARALGLLE